MAIAKSIKGVTDFLQGNEALIKDVVDQAKKIGDLFTQIEQAKDDVKALVDEIPNHITFAVAPSAAVKVTQTALLGEIADVSRKIADFKDQPLLVASLCLHRSGLYVALGNTYNSLVPAVIQFTQQEIDTLQVLIRRATLDAQARQRWADVLDAAVQISKAGLQLALKLAA